MSTNLCDQSCWLFVSTNSNSRITLLKSLICLILLTVITNCHCTVIAQTDTTTVASDTTTISSDLSESNLNISTNNNESSVETIDITSSTTTKERLLVTNSDTEDLSTVISTTTEVNIVTVDPEEEKIFPLYCSEPKNVPNPKEMCEISTANCPKCNDTDDTIGDTYRNIVIFSHDTSIITLMHIFNVPLLNMPVSVFEQYGNLAILQLENCQINELDGITNATKLKKLYISNNSIRQISEGQLHGAPHLRLLDATHNKIEIVDEKAFSNNENLYWLDLSYNRIGGLPWVVFQYLKAIVAINLSHNMIEELGLVCSGIETLSTLDLSYNRIKKIRFSTFERTTNLEEIHLGNNEIEMIEHNAFDQCSKLKSLDLSNNRLQSLHFDIPSSQFSSLLLFNNSIGELACTTRQQNISNLKLHAQNNQISTMFVQDGVPITDCNLDKNRLKSLSTLTKIYTLTSLRLSNNDLSESDDVSSFTNLQNLVELDLSNTNLQSQYIHYLFQLPNLIFWLDLSGNPSLASFEWNKITESPLTILRLNNCNLTDLSVPNLMLTLPALHEIELDENEFPCSVLRRILVDLNIRGITVIKKDVNDYDHVEGIRCINDTQVPQGDEPSQSSNGSSESPTLSFTSSEASDSSKNMESNTTKLLLLKPIVTHISPTGSIIAATETYESEAELKSEQLSSIVEPPLQFISTVPAPTGTHESHNGNSKSRIQIKQHVPNTTTSTIIQQSSTETMTSESELVTTQSPSIDESTT